MAKNSFLEKLERKPEDIGTADGSTTTAKNKEQIFLKSVHIYSHLDADGLSAAAILALTLQREKIGYQLTILRQLEPKHMDQIKREVEEFNKFIIFTDLGAGQLPIITEHLSAEDYLILDHHQPEHLDIPEVHNHVNPYFFGFDGSTEIAGAGVTYLFAKQMNAKNVDLAFLAIIGAIGDIQNKAKKGRFHGLNLKILEDAINSGKLTMEDNIAISRTRPIIQALAYTFHQNLPGISGNENQARIFLQKNDIKTHTALNEPRRLLDFSEKEKKALNSALLQYALFKSGLAASFSTKLVTTFYLLTDYEPSDGITDAREMSSFLNACGRSGNHALGIATLMGDKKALQRALSETRNYKKLLFEGIKWAREHLQDYEHIKAVYGGEIIDDRKIGTIAAMLIHSDLQIKKPLIAYAESDQDSFKVSARMIDALLEKGVDLGKILRRVCKEMGLENPAGGHPPAAGAKIPQSRLKEFLNLTNEEVGKVLNQKK